MIIEFSVPNEYSEWMKKNENRLPGSVFHLWKGQKIKFDIVKFNPFCLWNSENEFLNGWLSLGKLWVACKGLNFSIPTMCNKWAQLIFNSGTSASYFQL